MTPREPVAMLSTPLVRVPNDFRALRVQSHETRVSRSTANTVSRMKPESGNNVRGLCLRGLLSRSGGEWIETARQPEPLSSSPSLLSRSGGEWIETVKAAWGKKVEESLLSRSGGEWIETLIWQGSTPANW